MKKKFFIQNHIMRPIKLKGIAPGLTICGQKISQTNQQNSLCKNKAGYLATPVACDWSGAIAVVSGVFGQERYSQKPHESKVRQTNGQMDRQSGV